MHSAIRYGFSSISEILGPFSYTCRCFNPNFVYRTYVKQP